MLQKQGFFSTLFLYRTQVKYNGHAFIWCQSGLDRLLPGKSLEYADLESRVCSQTMALADSIICVVYLVLFVTFMVRLFALVSCVAGISRLS